MIKEREELTSQEYRDLKGSLSNRGCYFKQERGLAFAVDDIKKATHFICLDCVAKLPIKGVRKIIEGLGEKTVVRPLCAKCHIARVAKKIREGHS